MKNSRSYYLIVVWCLFKVPNAISWEVYQRQGPAGSENDKPLGSAGTEECLCATGEKGLLRDGCRGMLESRHQMVGNSGE